MKFTLLLPLLVLAASQTAFLQEEQVVDLQSQDIIEILKCFIDKAVPLAPEVVQLIEAIKKQDIITIISIAQKLYQAGQQAAVECIPQQYLLGLNQECLMNCAGTIIEKVESCKSLFRALKEKKDGSAILLYLFGCLNAVPELKSKCRGCI